MELFTYLMAKNDHNTSVKKDLFSYLLGKNQSGTYTEFTGTSISANNTKKGKMKVNLLGNTSQETTTGKNVLPNNNNTKTVNNVTFTVNNDKSLTLNGTASSITDLYFVGTYNQYASGDLSEGNYILSGCTTGSGTTYMLYVVQNRGGSFYYYQQHTAPINITVQSGDTFRIFMRVLENQTVNNVKVYPMLRLASVTDDTYEPYTNGASPNPDYPQDVHVVTGDNTIKVEGKNLFDGTGWRLVQSGNGFPTPSTGATIISSDKNNISFTSTQWAYVGVESGFIKVKANETYMLSAKFTTPTNRFFITQYDENKTRISTLNYINVSTLQNTSFTTTNNGYIAVAFTNTTTAQTTYKIEDIQIEKGSTATTYEPYQEQNYSVNLGSMELCKIGTYQDYFYKDNGSWYLHKEIGKVVLDSTNVNEYVNYLDTTTYSIPRIQLLKSNLGFKSSWDTGIALLNKYSEITTTRAMSNGKFALNFQQAYINIFDSRATDIATAKNILIGTEIYIVQATPTHEPITNTTLISQLNALAGAESYSGQTNISQTNDDLPFNLDVEIKVGN